MGVLEDLLFGVRTILANTVERPLRGRLNFGPTLTAVDDAVNKWTQVDVAPTFPAASPIVQQGTRFSVRRALFEVQTADATVTTLASYALADETLAVFDVVVTCVRQVGATKGGSYVRRVVYRRTGAGVATIVGALETPSPDEETDAGLDVTIDTDGAAAVRVRVTGLAATAINWGCELRVQAQAVTP